jgi:hypothetical protein
MLYKQMAWCMSVSLSFAWGLLTVIGSDDVMPAGDHHWLAKGGKGCGVSLWLQPYNTLLPPWAGGAMFDAAYPVLPLLSRSRDQFATSWLLMHPPLRGSPTSGVWP